MDPLLNLSQWLETASDAEIARVKREVDRAATRAARARATTRARAALRALGTPWAERIAATLVVTDLGGDFEGGWQEHTCQLIADGVTFALWSGGDHRGDNEVTLTRGENTVMIYDGNGFDSEEFYGENATRAAELLALPTRDALYAVLAAALPHLERWG
jgi:hypothetical protein